MSDIQFNTSSTPPIEQTGNVRFAEDKSTSPTEKKTDAQAPKMRRAEASPETKIRGKIVHSQSDPAIQKIAEQKLTRADSAPAALTHDTGALANLLTDKNKIKNMVLANPEQKLSHAKGQEIKGKVVNTLISQAKESGLIEWANGRPQIKATQGLSSREEKALLDNFSTLLKLQSTARKFDNEQALEAAKDRIADLDNMATHQGYSNLKNSGDKLLIRTSFEQEILFDPKSTVERKHIAEEFLKQEAAIRPQIENTLFKARAILVIQQAETMMAQMKLPVEDKSYLAGEAKQLRHEMGIISKRIALNPENYGAEWSINFLKTGPKIAARFDQAIKNFESGRIADSERQGKSI